MLRGSNRSRRRTFKSNGVLKMDNGDVGAIPALKVVLSPKHGPNSSNGDFDDAAENAWNLRQEHGLNSNAALNNGRRQLDSRSGHQRGLHALRCEWDLADAGAGGVEDRISDGRGGE